MVELANFGLSGWSLIAIIAVSAVSVLGWTTNEIKKLRKTAQSKADWRHGVNVALYETQADPTKGIVYSAGLIKEMQHNTELTKDLALVVSKIEERQKKHEENERAHSVS